MQMVETNSENMPVVVVGSVGLDDIETPFEKKRNLLGGSVSYACAASSFFSPTGMVGIAGDDFPEEHMETYRSFGIDLEGLQVVPGRTFRWSGVYDEDMINRQTISTELNVFETFSPELPEVYRKAPFILLGNISPRLQLHVLSQTEKSSFVIADTMDLWINTAREPLMELIAKVDMLMLNDSEARLLTGQHNVRQCAGRILDMGPEYVVIKRGEHGAMLACRDGLFLVPAFPVTEVHDPTGAGDAFAGGFTGHLARAGRADLEVIREGLLNGSVTASFGVEAFSLDRLKTLSLREIDRRRGALEGMIAL